MVSVSWRALGNTSSCGKALMELYEWGWIKKIPRIAVINARVQIHFTTL
ncbi:MAG: hypothetical protein CM1200mP11_3040 [Nitrosopumilaceae archaeon]|nr:MAG: hypothetical protein CM1200mP11_3040 [Nitrosopumilaceae archaeon]